MPTKASSTGMGVTEDSYRAFPSSRPKNACTLQTAESYRPTWKLGAARLSGGNRPRRKTSADRQRLVQRAPQGHIGSGVAGQVVLQVARVLVPCELESDVRHLDDELLYEEVGLVADRGSADGRRGLSEEEAIEASLRLSVAITYEVPLAPMIEALHVGSRGVHRRLRRSNESVKLAAQQCQLS